MGVTLASLITPLSQEDVLAALLSALQGVGQVVQSGAGGAAPVGLGTLSITGVPAAAYGAVGLVTSGTPSSPLEPTTALAVNISLDNGVSWSGVQSSGGQSPWVLPLADYRSGGATGLTLTFTDGSIPADSWSLNESYVFPTLTPTYPLTDFASGSVQRTLVEADALVTSDWTGLIASITAGGFTTLASLPWLILLASNLYNLAWRGPTVTIGQVLLQDAGGAGPFTLQQGQLWFAAISGNLYQLATTNTVTLPKNGYILVEVQAQNPGAAYNDPAGSISSSVSPGALVTSLPGVVVSNPLGTNLGAFPWVANLAYLGGYGAQALVDGGNGYLYIVEPGGYAGTGTSGGTQPTFPTTIGATVVDNPGANQITWTCYGVNSGAAANTYVQSGATPAPGAVYPYIPTLATSLFPLNAADVVVEVYGSANANNGLGYIGQVAVRVSINAGLTFNAAYTPVPLTAPAGSALSAWAPTTSYSNGNQVVPTLANLNGSWFQSSGGTHNSSGTEPAWPTTTGSTVSDGSLTWTNMGPVYAKINDGSNQPHTEIGVYLTMQDAQAAPSFYVGDAYVFDSDWAIQYGNAAETAAQLALRCQQQWGTLASAAPLAQIEAWAKAASTAVETAVASPDPGGSGAVSLYIAGTSGSVSTAAVAAVSAYVTARLPIGSTLLNGVAVSAQNSPITLGGTVYCPAAQIATAQAVLSQALIALANASGIGNTNATTGTVYFSQVSAAVQSAIGTGHVDGLTLTPSAGGTANTSHDIQMSAGYIATFAAVSSMTWIGI